MQMGQLPFIMTNSITYAIKGRDYLNRNGIRAYIERTPKGKDNTGCGYSIYVNGDINYAKNLLKQAGIKIKEPSGNRML